MPTQVFATPAVVDGVVYLHARNDHIYALRAKDGGVVWKTPAPAPQDEGTVFSDMTKSSPAVDARRVYVGFGRDLVALDRATGRVLWRAPTGGKMDSSPLVIGPTVYIGSDDGRLYAFDADSGRKTWDFATRGKISIAPSAAAGILLVGSNDGFLYAFTPAR